MADEMDDATALAKIDALLNELPTSRNRSRYATPDAPVGSKAYWTKWRAANEQRTKLYQKKAYLKRKVMTLAVERAAAKAVQENSPLDVEAEYNKLDLKIELAAIERQKALKDGTVQPKEDTEDMLWVIKAKLWNVPVNVAKDIIDYLPYQVWNSDKDFHFDETNARLLEELKAAALEEKEL